MRHRPRLITALLLASTAACGEGADNPEIELTPELVARAGIDGGTARATALARVPGGIVKSAELEEEDGLLVYSFDIRVEGESGVTEILVDATTGQIVSEDHETDDDEAAEEQDDEGGDGDNDDREGAEIAVIDGVSRSEAPT